MKKSIEVRGAISRMKPYKPPLENRDPEAFILMDFNESPLPPPEGVVQKISELKEIRKNINANYEIEIDGGINYQTSKICIDKGADILVAGSYVYGAPKEEYKDKINSIRHLT